MGNHGSRKEGRRSRSSSSSGTRHGDGQAVHALKRVEEVRGPPADSYDKLIAWLSEMAESDNVHLDTSVFVKQLSSVCSSSSASSHYHTAPSSSLGGTGPAGSERSSSGAGLNHVMLGGGARRGQRATLRQNSASCDSRASSADTRGYHSGRSTYSRSFDDTLDPRHAWRQHMFSSRQGTVSDDLEEDPDVRNASMESLYSGSDRDSDLDAMPSTYTMMEPSAARRARFSQQREQQWETSRPLLRQALLGSFTFSSRGGESEMGKDTENTDDHDNKFSQQRELHRETSRPLLRQALLGSSIGSSQDREEGAGRRSSHGVPRVMRGSSLVSNVSHFSHVSNVSNMSHVSGVSSAGGRCYSGGGYGSCNNRSSMVTIGSNLLPSVQVIPCSASTGDLDKLNEALEEVRAGEQARAPTPDRMSRRRSVSLLNLTPPGRAAYYVPDSDPPDHEPPTPAGGVLPPMFLDDALLDGNLADILFSVEALWSNK